MLHGEDVPIWAMPVSPASSKNVPVSTGPRGTPDASTTLVSATELDWSTARTM
jgi:hypothetical protein